MADPIQTSLDTVGLGTLDSRILSLGQREQGLLKQSSDVAEQQRAQSEQAQETMRRRTEETAAPREALLKKLKDTPSVTAKEEAIPEYQRPTMKPEEFREAFSTLMVASMLTSLASRHPYTNVMGAMTGAMNGLVKGDTEIVKQSMETFDRNLTAIKEKNAQKRREVDDAWKRYKNDTQGLATQLELISAKYDDILALESARSKSLSDTQKLIDTNIRSVDSAITQIERVKGTIQARQDKIEQDKRALEQRADIAHQAHLDRVAAMGNRRGDAGTVVPEEHRDLHGADYLSTLPAGVAGTVKALSEGRETFASLGYRGADRQAMVQRVNQYNPNFQQGQQVAKSGVLKDFTSGQQSKNIVAINQAVSHMGTLDDLGKALENKDTRLVNVFLNRLADETGDPRINNFQLATQAVGDELMRTFRQVGASETEALAFQQKFKVAGSPAQIREALQTGAKLLSGRIKAVNNSWKRGMEVDTDYPKLVDPEPAEVLKRFGIEFPSGAVNSPATDGETKSIGEKTYVKRDGKWFEK